jgi:hypothetical protein
MKKIQLIAVLMLSAIITTAQNETDALRFSQFYYQGTARSMAMGGAFGALGADFSTLSTNPAGLGLYRSSEFSVTPELFNRKTESTYNGMFGDNSRGNFGLGNMGLVFAYEVPEGATQTPWKYYHFAMGMNRINNFGNRSFIRGDNHDHSRVDVWLDDVWTMNPEDIESQGPFDLYPAWYVYLLDTVSIDGLLYYTSPVPMGGIRQEEDLTSWGSTNEWLFAGGANLNDVVYFGATLGLPFTRYFRESTYREVDIADTISGFDYWSFKERVETRGWGVNLKLGVIVWPVDWLRLGVAMHTPTYFYGLSDTWYTTTEARLGPDFNRKDSPTGEFEYTITTPLRAIGSASFIFGNFGSISADYEFVDYSKMRLRSLDYNFNNENDIIRDVFASTANLRFGTEWRYTNFNFRGGYSIYGSPYDKNINDGERRSYSLGLGYTERDFGIDVAWVRGTLNQDYYLYSSPNYTTNPTKQEMITDNFVLTMRFRF